MIAIRMDGRIREPTAVMGFEKRPEERALQEIVAQALAEGRQVFVLGPAGILEVGPSRIARES
jgi:hypothetical protein